MDITEFLIRQIFALSPPFPFHSAHVELCLSTHLRTVNHGDLNRWQQSLESIRRVVARQGTALRDGAVVSVGRELAPSQRWWLRHHLMQLHPWRKGPFRLCGVTINSEWRSDMKWRRFASRVDWHQKKVLDIGCSNGYYFMRAMAAGAAATVGVDPNLSALHQHLSIRSALPEMPCWLLPLPFEKVPSAITGFDIVLSLGVMYHRPSPRKHLQSIRERLIVGGMLVIETLTLPDHFPTMKLQPAPSQRYAQMNNVWHLLRPDGLRQMLWEHGFDIRYQHTAVTTPAEQRRSSWMRFHSLSQFLATDSPDVTVEGLPAPRRTTVIAVKH